MSLPELMSLVFRGSPASGCKAADLQGRARPEFALGADQAGRPHERDDDRRDHAPIRRRPQGLNDPVRESASRKGESDIPDQSVAAVLHEGCGEPRGNEPCDKDREERSWGHDSSPFCRLQTPNRAAILCQVELEPQKSEPYKRPRRFTAISLGLLNDIIIQVI